MERWSIIESQQKRVHEDTQCTTAEWQQGTPSSDAIEATISKAVHVYSSSSSSSSSSSGGITVDTWRQLVQLALASTGTAVGVYSRSNEVPSTRCTSHSCFFFKFSKHCIIRDYVPVLKFDASRRGENVLNHYRDENARRVPQWGRGAKSAYSV